MCVDTNPGPSPPLLLSPPSSESQAPSLGGGANIQSTQRKPGFCFCTLWPLESINNLGGVAGEGGWPYSSIFIWREENVRSLSCLSSPITPSSPLLHFHLSSPSFSSISPVMSPSRAPAPSVSFLAYVNQITIQLERIKLILLEEVFQKRYPGMCVSFFMSESGV